MNAGKNESPPIESVQLAPDDGVFELPGAQPAWIWVHTCPDRACSCRAALVLATQGGREHLLERGAAVREAWNTGTGYAKTAGKLDDLIVFFLDIDTAEVSTLTDYKPLSLAAHPRLADIATRIDGDLLESLGQLWYRGKGWPDPEQEALLAKGTGIKDWPRGGMVAWDDLCTGVRQDLYVLEDRVYEAAEMYCPVPDCTCAEVVVLFEAIRPRGAPDPGRIVVQLSGATQSEPFMKNYGDRLQELWAAFRQRHPNYLARFARRYPAVKQIGARSLPPPPAKSTKRGRNDACPCGSGKKYKKCCGAN